MCWGIALKQTRQLLCLIEEQHKGIRLNKGIVLKLHLHYFSGLVPLYEHLNGSDSTPKSKT